MDNTQKCINLKLIALGDYSVGKTNLIKSFFQIKDDWHRFSIIQTKKLKKDYQLRVWDTQGQERFGTTTQQYYSHTDGVLFVFDITNRQSFNSINKWVKLYNEQTIKKKNISMLVGNKCEKEDKRLISFSEGQELANSLGMDFIETDAFKHINVDQAFNKLIDAIIQIT